MNKLLTAKQLSELLQIDLSTVYLWTHTEFIPCYRIGRSVRFKEDQVMRWLEKRRQQGRATFKREVVTN